MIDTDVNIVDILNSFPIGVSATLLGVAYLYKHPEQFQKWSGMFWWAVSSFWKNAEYLAIKNEVQGKINNFVRNLEAKTTAQFPRISIRWAGREQEEIVWEDYEAIIVMRDRRHRNKNFVHAAYFFTSESLLKKSKRHLSKTQKESLDLFATKIILESESNASVEQFMNDYFVPKIEQNEGIRGLVQKYIHIHRIGVFFPILIQELTFLGNKIFLTKPTEEVIKEVKALVDFLEKFSEREVGDVTTPDTFIGKYTRCAIKIVASRPVRERGVITSHKERIENAIKSGFENVYMIGSSQHKNEKFMNEVCKAVCADHKQIELVKTYNFKGQIKIKGELTNVSTYLIYLHNPNAVKYLLESSDIGMEELNNISVADKVKTTRQ